MWYTLILNPKCHWIKWSVHFYAITSYYPNDYPECQLEDPIATTISRNQDSLSPRIRQKEVYVSALSIEGTRPFSVDPHKEECKKQKEESILHILLAICVGLCFMCQKGGKESFQEGCPSPHRSGWGQRQEPSSCASCSRQALGAAWESQSCLFELFSIRTEYKSESQCWVLSNLVHNDFVKSWTWVSACQLGGESLAGSQASSEPHSKWASLC